jgi:hypothetical protein
LTNASSVETVFSVSRIQGIPNQRAAARTKRPSTPISNRRRLAWPTRAGICPGPGGVRTDLASPAPDAPPSAIAGAPIELGSLLWSVISVGIFQHCPFPYPPRQPARIADALQTTRLGATGKISPVFAPSALSLAQAQERVQGQRRSRCTAPVEQFSTIAPRIGTRALGEPHWGPLMGWSGRAPAWSASKLARVPNQGARHA